MLCNLRGASSAIGFAALATSTILVPAIAARAHATLESAQAAPNTTYKGVVRISHGCNGAATTRVAITIPEGIIAAQPMPKSGWTLTTVKGPYDRSYMLHGKPVAEGVKEMAWSGGKLLDEHFDEFVFMARITDHLAPGTTVHFPVVQECETGANRWVEIPGEGRTARSLKSPAPALRIIVAEAGAGRAHAQKAGTFSVGSLVVEAPWSRATPAGAKVAGGYARITNRGALADRLVGVSLAAAQTGEVHEMTTEGGVMRMRPLEAGLEIAPGRTIELMPGGYHLMFLGLTQPLKEGDSVKGILTFERAGRVEVDFTVRAIGASAPQAGGAGHEHRH